MTSKAAWAALTEREGDQSSPDVFVDLKQDFIVFEVGVPPAVGVRVQRLRRDRKLKPGPEDCDRGGTVGLTWSSMVTSSLEQPDFALEIPGWMIISLRNWEYPSLSGTQDKTINHPHPSPMTVPPLGDRTPEGLRFAPWRQIVSTNLDVTPEPRGRGSTGPPVPLPGFRTFSVRSLPLLLQEGGPSCLIQGQVVEQDLKGRVQQRRQVLLSPLCCCDKWIQTRANKHRAADGPHISMFLIRRPHINSS